MSNTILDASSGTSSSSSTSTGNAANVAANGATSDLSQMFTKLLVAQIQNQDPTAPTDPSTYVNQLATLSQTESLQSMTSATSANASILQSLQVLALGAQVGSTLTVSTSQVRMDGTPVQGSVSLDSGTSKANVVLTNTAGQQYSFALGAQNAGTVPFTLDPAQLGIPDGSYSIAVQTDSQTSLPVQISGTLNSVRLTGSGGASLAISHVGDVTPDAVTGFYGVSNVSH